MLPEILAHKREELRKLDRADRLAAMKDEIGGLPPAHRLGTALTRQSRISLIAEIKRKSPSKGVLADQIDPATVAGEYKSAGAAAVSVLTDRKFFDGASEDLKAVRSHVDLPILRKDFVIDEYQVYESRLIGADVILLIAAALDPGTLEKLYHLAYGIGLDVLLEVHNPRELERILPFQPEIIGVNNRDLQTFTTDLAVAERLREKIPAETICVAESGIHSRADMLRMQQAGYHAALIGEGIITAPDRTQRIRELLGTDVHTS